MEKKSSGEAQIAAGILHEYLFSAQEMDRVFNRCSRTLKHPVSYIRLEGPD